MSEELRTKILLLLYQHSQTGSNRYMEESELAAQTGADILEVRQAMDILESADYTRTANSLDGRAAVIAPKGLLAVEQIRKGPASEGPPIGF
jgi:hypothetical protein